MKTMKQTLSVFLAAICLLCGFSLPFPRAAAKEAVSGVCGDDMEWIFDELTDTLTIRGSGRMDDFDYEETPWQFYAKSIVSLVMEGDIQNISMFAFKGCSSLTSVELDNRILQIEAEAFAGCTQLLIFNTPLHTNWIGEKAFAGCNRLRDIFLPETLVTVGENAFKDCYNLNDCHFGGSEAAWSSVTIVSGNDWLTRATLHCNATRPLCFPHSYTLKIETVREATCTEDGLQTYTFYCVKCGEVQSREERTIPAHHTAGIPEYVTLKEGNCTEYGERQKIVHCSVCGYLMEDKIETTTLNHTPGRTEEVVLEPATCTSFGKGETTTYCSVCGKVITKTTHLILTLGHNYNFRYHRDADGKYYQECVKCGYRTEPVDELPEGYCKYCYQKHLLPIIEFFHNILYFFKQLFGKA